MPEKSARRDPIFILFARSGPRGVPNRWTQSSDKVYATDGDAQAVGQWIPAEWDPIRVALPLHPRAVGSVVYCHQGDDVAADAYERALVMDQRTLRVEAGWSIGHTAYIAKILSEFRARRAMERNEAFRAVQDQVIASCEVIARSRGRSSPGR